MKTSFFVWLLLLGSPTLSMAQQQEDPIEVQIGERLFNEDRFSFLFFKNFGGQVNSKLEIGDPSLDIMDTPQGPYPNPFRGKHMSCGSCHMVDQAKDIPGLGVVNYNDFVSRTKVSDRGDGHSTSVRHTSTMVGTVFKAGVPLHWDGEFFSADELAEASLIGRNMGWENSEAERARQHIVQVVMQDNGSINDGFIDGSYFELLQKVGVNLTLSSNAQILSKICSLITDYMVSIQFNKVSAFDDFMAANKMPIRSENEDKTEYLDRLIEVLATKTDWTWIPKKSWSYHEPTKFEQLELDGFKLFVGRAQCARCHTPPDFTDHGFHNIGIEQLEYESRNGVDTFSSLDIPTQAERLGNPHTYFVASEQHPYQLGIYRRIPSAEHPEYADLGVWNMFGHPDKPHTQTMLQDRICQSLYPIALEYQDCLRQSVDELLPKTVAMFKTPSLRNLGQSAPYFHNGSVLDTHQILVMYMALNNLARRGRLINPDPMLKEMRLKAGDFQALRAFLNSLNEDYD